MKRKVIEHNYPRKRRKTPFICDSCKKEVNGLANIKSEYYRQYPQDVEFKKVCYQCEKNLNFKYLNVCKKCKKKTGGKCVFIKKDHERRWCKENEHPQILCESCDIQLHGCRFCKKKCLRGK